MDSPDTQFVQCMLAGATWGGHIRNTGSYCDNVYLKTFFMLLIVTLRYVSWIHLRVTQGIGSLNLESRVADSFFPTMLHLQGAPVDVKCL